MLSTRPPGLRLLRAFIAGIGSILEAVWSAPPRRAAPQTEDVAAADWEAIGRDFRAAIARYETEQRAELEGHPRLFDTRSLRSDP